MHSRFAIALAVAVGAGLALTGAHAYGRPRPTIVLSHPLPSVVRQGDQVTMTGRVRGQLTVPPPCDGFCVVLVELEGRRMYGPPAARSFRVLAKNGCCGRAGAFSLTWRVSRKLAVGPLSLRLILLYPPASRPRRILAANRATQSWVGPAPGYCAPPTPPASVPPGDGWIVGGLYVEGGPFPGIDECESGPYTVTATARSGAVGASQQVAGGHSYTLVLPAGTYTLRAGCSVQAQATVTAGQQTKANTACLVP